MMGLAVSSDRYQLEERIGSGGMGQVFRAHDRLTGQVVALKRVARSGLPHDTPSRSDLSLASEFTILAKLRHPHIISVLDYGFDVAADGQRIPFYTMEYLSKAESLLVAAFGQPFETQLGYLIQTLQALVYLHRHGILHRDLKPDNILVTAERSIKVLDFGLAQFVGEVHQRAGTMLYAAPEVLLRQPASIGSDLYAIGVIAHELLCGKLPYDLSGDSPRQWIERIIHAPPVVHPTVSQSAIAPVIERLLHKDAAQRYPDAEAVIQALAAAADYVLPPENSAIRESFLQASEFIGREDELAQLLNALHELDGDAPHGSAWLIGGESGVGKSRLVDELRIQALVTGALVLHGQGMREGGLSYQVWRDPLRRLVLSLPLDDHQAAILRPLVPDLAQLLGRPIRDTSVLEGRTAQERINSLIVELFRQIKRPTVLILEDLQWSHECLMPLHQLSRIVGELPVLIVASFQDDTAPNLPQRLRQMRYLKLERLQPTQITALVRSMLGEAGDQPAVVEFIQRQTEGNLFFIIETVRVLAQQAGSLQQIAHHPLPTTISAAGIQQIIRHRLGSIPLELQPLLRVAALIGRQINLILLQAIADRQSAWLDLAQWLMICIHASIIEVRGNQWQFTHDKLREILLLDLPDEERRPLHQLIAESIEQVYREAPDAIRWLADHWYHAGNIDQCCHYTLLTVEQELATSDYQDSLMLLERAAHQPGLDEQSLCSIRLNRWMGTCYYFLNRYELAVLHYERSLMIASETGQMPETTHALNGLGLVASAQSDFQTASSYHQEALERSDNQPGSYVLALQGLAEAAEGLGDMDTAEGYYEASLMIWESHNNLFRIAEVQDALGELALARGLAQPADEYFQTSLKLRREIRDRLGTASCLTHLGILAIWKEDFPTAERYFTESYQIYDEVDNRVGCGYNLGYLGQVARLRGDFEAAVQQYERSLEIFHKIGDRAAAADVLHQLGLTQADRGEPDAAGSFLEQSLALYRSIGDQKGICDTLADQAHLLGEQGKVEEALIVLTDGLQIARQYQLAPTLIKYVAAYAAIMAQRDQLKRSAELLGLVWEQGGIVPGLRGRIGRLRQRVEPQLTIRQFYSAWKHGATLNLSLTAADIYNAETM